MEVPIRSTMAGSQNKNIAQIGGNLIISPPLARDLAKRNMREVSREIQANFDDLEVPAYKRRGQIYRAYLRIIREAFDGYILREIQHNDKKRSGCIWLVWWPVIVDGRSSLLLLSYKLKWGKSQLRFPFLSSLRGTFCGEFTSVLLVMDLYPRWLS